MDTEGEDHAPQISFVADVLANRSNHLPVVLAGDFNTDPDSAAIAPLYHQGHRPTGSGVFHEVDEFHLNAEAPHDEATHESDMLPDRKIDYIFVSPTFTDLRGRVKDARSSDHHFLFGTAAINPGGRGGPAPVIVDAGPDARGDEGSSIRLRGSARWPGNVPPDAPAPSVSWSYRARSDVDDGTTCTFTDRAVPRTNFTCTDDGTFRVTLTAQDPVYGPIRDSATVQVKNVAPQLKLSGPDPWQVYRAGDPVELTASFADPGSNDTHTCIVDWDDGNETDRSRPTRRHCDGSRTFHDAGMYTIRPKVTDDDGGADTASVLTVVYEPTLSVVSAAGRGESPAGSYSPDHGAQRPGRFAALARYVLSRRPQPTGAVAFELGSATLRLRSHHLDWLVVTPEGEVAIKGTARGSSGEYGFVLYAHGRRWRMVVWPRSQGAVPPIHPLYDSNRGASYDIDVADPQPISSGVGVVLDADVPAMVSPETAAEADSLADVIAQLGVQL